MGAALPRGWQFVLMAADTPRSQLRDDGFPGLGVPMPALGLPRLLLGGRTVEFLADIPIGATVRRLSGIRDLVRKETAKGPMAIATVAHELFVDAAAKPALREMQTYLLMEERARRAPSAEAETTLVVAEHSKVVVPDATMLFQYSALGFNSHRVHLDRAYAREVEGFPDLVVNGGVITLLLTEFLRTELGLVPRSLRVKHLAPLFCDRPMKLTADREGAAWRLKALDDRGRPAADMEVDTL